MSLSPRSRVKLAVAGSPALSRLAVATTFATSAGCVWLLDRPPGRAVDPITKQDTCTAHYGATAVDALAGTLSLVGGVLGFWLGGFAEGFTAIGVVGVGGAAMHYASAASNQVGRCQRLKREPWNNHSAGPGAADEVGASDEQVKALVDLWEATTHAE